ncbi:MAG: 4-hydroxyphenylpyruvate dioxygenase [Cyanobacteria bacterium P01_A01_bin.116]
MHFHHLHFYVRDAAFWRNWFASKLSFESVEQATCVSSPCAERLRQGNVDICLSDPASSVEAAQYLRKHPPGLVDIALATDRFEEDYARAKSQGASLTKPITIGPDGMRQCQLHGWADLRHTLIEVSSSTYALAGQHHEPAAVSPWLSAIDHVVLNVDKGDLAIAAGWYQRVFGLQRGQQFEISTANSGLRSQVLIHPTGTLQLPINEPSSANSQIQEFLHHNQGAGAQHVALRSQDAVSAIAHFRQQGLALISVPKTYYDGLHQRADCPLQDTTAASRQQLLLDWPKGGHQGLLMQTFTKPIFTEPTFFFEIIERTAYLEQGQLKSARGFGEGNFQALFEAIERAQLERGSLR